MEHTNILPIVAVLPAPDRGVRRLGSPHQHHPGGKIPAGELADWQKCFFRAGHAHARVLLVLSLGYLPYLPRAEFSDTWEWIAGIVLLVEIAVQSGGFLHLAVGEPGRPSAGTKLTRTGALLIAAALIALAVG